MVIHILTFVVYFPDLDQQSVHSDPEEAFLRDLPEFPSVDEFPSIEHSLLHFPLRASGQAPGDGAQGEPSAGEALSPASLLFQHLASPLHFVNTHFNGHGRPPGGDQGTPAERKEAASAQGPRHSLEALSEEIVSTAISTVVQNTLSALLRSTEASEGPSMEEFLPAETLPNALDSPPPAEASQETLEDEVATETREEEMQDDTLVPTEEEDFELLDQSELELMDEGLGLSPDGQGLEGEALPRNTPPSPQHQQES